MFNKIINFWYENTPLFLLLLPFELLAASLVLTIAVYGQSPPAVGVCVVVFGVFILFGTLLATVMLLVTTVITEHLLP